MGLYSKSSIVFVSVKSPVSLSVLLLSVCVLTDETL